MFYASTKIRIHRICFLLIVGCGIPSLVFARWIPHWIHQPREVTNRSDVIVVASPLDSRLSGPSTNSIRAGFDPDWQLSTLTNAFVPTETTFQVAKRLKGELNTNRLVVFHYTVRPDLDIVNQANLEVNGPRLVSFEKHFQDPRRARHDPLPQPKYRLFLKRMAGGRFRATTGQIDAGLSIEFLGSQAVDGRHRRATLKATAVLEIKAIEDAFEKSRKAIK